jgi:homoserine O-acetyltransferase
LTESPDYDVFAAGDVVLQSGLTYRRARLAYKTFGTLNRERSNVILYPTSFGAQHPDLAWNIGGDSPLDPSRYFIVIANLFGNGLSSSPSTNDGGPRNMATYPHFTIADNVRLQERMLRERFGVERLRLVYGFSMGGQQALQWGAMFPGKVERICAICATARTAPHTWVMFEGVRAALTSDAAWHDGWFHEHPVRGLRAMGRVYAGWGFSQAFYRDGLYRQLGFTSLEDFLVRYWEARFLKRNANDLLAMIWTLQHADVSTATFGGDIRAALGAIRAQVLAMPSATDLYFTVEDVRREMADVRNGELLPIPSVWGHRAGDPASHPPDAAFIFDAVRRLLGD